MAEAWRVVVPNTSISCLPVVVPPALTIIGQNFNVILCESPDTAIAIGVALSRPAPQQYLIGISPWSQGDTPRPRSKHVNATLWTFEMQIQSLLDSARVALLTLAQNLEHVWRLHVSAAISLAKAQLSDGLRFRDVYSAINPRESHDSVPVNLLELRDQDLTLGLSNGLNVQIRFDTAQNAARAAVASWSAIPHALTIGDILNLSCDPTVPCSSDAVREILFEESWKTLVARND